MRGITLEQISESTKISVRRLEALENEEFELLPGGIFNRGFVRSYARYIGLDPDQAVADYVVASREQSAPEDQFPLEVQRISSRKGSPALNPRRSWLPIVIAVLALIGVMTGWRMWTRRNSTRPAASSAAPHATPNSSGASSSGAAPALQPAVENQQELPKLKVNTLVITAKSDSWVSIKADGKTVMEGILGASQTRSVKFENELVLLTGNAGGVEVTYNGKPQGSLGEERKRLTLVFPPKAGAQ